MLVAAGCGTHARGDPGGKRLKELSRDAVFAAVPRDATVVRFTRTPARYRQPAFQTGGWDGPSVALTLRSAAPPSTLYRFYDRRAKASGWHATASGSFGLVDRWTKTYSDGARASLSFALLTLPLRVSPRLYRLAGGVSLP